jgi:glycyl-tRNA synthetase beta chain
MRGELLLELLCEEVPARMQRRAIEDLQRLLGDKLAAAQIPAASMTGHVTPRRLAVVAQGIPARQPDRREERRGPRLGAPPQALDGFLRAAGLASIEDCEIRDSDRGRFYFAIIERPGQDSAKVLPELVHAAIAELPWPKSMRYPASSLRWVRPLNSAICLYDGAVLPLPLDRVPVGRLTWGHRWLSNGAIEIADAAAYAARLAEAHVVLDRDERRRRIEEGLAEAAAAAQVAVVPDPELLDEVTGLVEFPVVLMGAIDPGFMTLPPEVLRASMRTHQRYFCCVNPDGSAAARFLFVADNLAADGGRTIVAGNERVLRARLADARFFWDQDRKLPLAGRVEELRGRVYHEKLGSMYDKAERIAQIVHFVAAAASAETGLAVRAARLAKADLSTAMVGEFPELQGIMGRYYALNDGEDARVAEAVADHYRPLGPRDTCPTRPDSVAVALADKIDSLVAFFAIGETPTGSRDPFALRRAALGVIRLILENRLRLSLRKVLHDAWMAAPFGGGDPTAELLEFIADRLKVHLREEGARHDLIAAVFALAEDDLVRLMARVDALRDFLATQDGANLLVAYRRAANIVAIEERRDGRSYDGKVVEAIRFAQPEERALWQLLDGMSLSLEEFLRGERFDRAMELLATLRPAVDAFFDKVTVNTDDAILRDNRLRLLARIRDTMNQVADFSKIEG